MRSLWRLAILVPFLVPYVALAEQNVTEALGDFHDPSVDGIRQSLPGGAARSIYGADGKCRVQRRNNGGAGRVNPPVDITGGVGATQAVATPAPPPQGPADPPPLENPSLVDVQAFVGKYCNTCHKPTEAKLNADQKIRIVEGSVEKTFAEALNAVNTVEEMKKLKNNPSIVKALETWSKLP